MPTSRILSFPTQAVSGVIGETNLPSRSYRAASKLRQAAALVETVAFDEAGEHHTSVISQLIMSAATLERLAQTLEHSTSSTC